MKKYYQILGLEKGASKQEVQDAYDKLSVELDPKNHDQNKNFWNYALLIISKTTDEIKRK
jgi:DnaJ-class molecular chaperone